MNKNLETEITFYAKIGNPEGLKQADSIEDHEQLEVRLSNGNKLRVRKVTKKDSNIPEYVFTAKIKEQEDTGEPETIHEVMEYSINVNEAFLLMFSEIMEQRIEKRRFFFKNRSIVLTVGGIGTPIHLDNVCFEVDSFKTNGRVPEYVKIDLEVDQILKYLDEHYPDLNIVNLNVKLGNLPFNPINIIYPPVASDEEKAIVEDLWKNHYTTDQKVAVA